METIPTILVVDDDESNRDSLSRRLERRGYAVSIAVDGQDALNQVSAKAFDLIILDVMMPGISGLEVLDTLRKTYTASQLPIIMATARDRSEDLVIAFEKGANDYVTKPLDFAVVTARVKTQLQLKKSIDQILLLEADLKVRNDELNAANAKLIKAAERTALELNAAAKVQRAFLPHANPPVTGAKFSWVFEPCTELAGDSLNVVQLDENHVGLYVLDVSGHGVAASLLAVTVTRLLSPQASGDSLVLHVDAAGKLSPTPPSEVATRLTQSFQFETTAQFVTLFYAVYHTTTRDLTFVSAGHPGAVRVEPDGFAAVLNGTGLPIGVGETFDQQSIQLNTGSRLYLYSDGVTEAMDEAHELFGTDRLLNCLKNAVAVPLTESISNLQTQVSQWHAGAEPKDDISILGMECT